MWCIFTGIISCGFLLHIIKPIELDGTDKILNNFRKLTFTCFGTLEIFPPNGSIVYDDTKSEYYCKFFLIHKTAHKLNTSPAWATFEGKFFKVLFFRQPGGGTIVPFYIINDK